MTAILTFFENLRGHLVLQASLFAGLLMTSTPLLAQEEVPDQGIRLPSVSEYSLPPGDQNNPSTPAAEGPAEEGAPPPEPAAPSNPAPTPSLQAPATQPSPVPVQTAPPVARQTNPAPVRAQPQSQTRQPPQPSIATPSVATGPATTTAEQQMGDANRLPDESSTQAPLALPVPDRAEQVSAEPANDATAFPIWLIALAGILLTAGFAVFFVRRKRSAVSTNADQAAAEPETRTEPKPSEEPEPMQAVAKTRSTAKVYSPPNPAEQPEPSPVTSDGFITTKIGVPSKRQQPATGNPPPEQPKQNTITKQSTDQGDLKIEFFAEKASSTLINAVVGFRLKLSNEGQNTLQNIKIFGELIQADQNAAMLPAMQRNNMIDEVKELPAGNIVEIPGEVRLPLNSIIPISFKNQALFIPLARLELEIENEDGSVTEQSASFIVGQEHQPPRAKMAPFRLDLGPRNFDPVGQRAIEI